MTGFGTAGIRGPVADVLTPALAVRVGLAVGAPCDPVALGRDGRETGPALADAVSAGLRAAGSPVERLGVVPTPALAYASRGRRGIMVTASHNPPGDNGLKLYVDGTAADSEREAAVETALEAGPAPAAWDRWAPETTGTVLPDYRAHVVGALRERFGRTPLAGTSIAVDCGSGVGGLATPAVLERLGADVTAINDAVDGHFPARESTPRPGALETLSRLVAGGESTLGIAHDGDADRVTVLGADGAARHPDTILAAVARAATERATVADPVVLTTPNASRRIDAVVTGAGGRVERAPLGGLPEGIARLRGASDDGTRVVFAAEPNKHLHPDVGGWIDGVLAAGVVACLAADAGGLAAICADVPSPPAGSADVDCPTGAKDAAMETIGSRLPRAVPGTVSTDHGVRIDRPDGSWVLVRPSGTEPVVRIYAEGDDLEDLLETARAVVAEAVAAAAD